MFSLTGKLRARGRQAGHCGVAGQVMAVAVEGRRGLRDARLGLRHNAGGWGPIPPGLSGGRHSKEWTERRMGGMGERRKGRLFKKKLLSYNQ